MKKLEVLPSKADWVVVACCLFAAFPAILSCDAQAQERRSQRQQQRPEPTHADVAYAPHDQNKIDVWLADSEEPTPLVIYIHGGGFRNGSKSGISASTIEKLREAGISVASVEYRFVQHAKLPAAHHDCRRALQFLRSKAGAWNFDKNRIGAFGGSAGAQLCMYLGFHDEMRNKDSDDPIEHESTRLACVATSGGQTSMDFDWWMKWVPGYDKPHRERSESFDSRDDEEHRRTIADISALSLISKDDPPIFMEYGMRPGDPVPSGEKAQGWKVHHVVFGVKLKEEMDKLGVEAVLKYPGAPAPEYPSKEDFFIAKFGGTNN